MNPLRLELGIEEAIELFIYLGEDDGSLFPIRRALREYLYEQLTIERFESLEQTIRERRGHREGGRAPRRGNP